jgi:AcrR family transcriptional regulator
VRADVLRCAAELLTEVGYDKMSVEEVASRAGVHKTTVYRRWPTKPELVADAASVHSADAVPIPDTGSLLEDLRLLARSVAANIGSEGGARRSRSVVAAAATSEELTKSMQAFWANRFTSSAEIVERAIERGELPPTADANLIIETLVGPLWIRLLLTGEPIDNDVADQVAEIATAGALHHKGEHPEGSGVLACPEPKNCHGRG